MINLDLDSLRTLVTAMNLGGFARAAERLHLSQSAVSLQMRRLEAQVGETLLRKQGRGLALTNAGDVFLGYARRLLELNDEAVAAVKGVSVEGAVRLGMPADFAETWIPTVLAHFSRSHPTVRMEAHVDRNAILLDRLDRGLLDLALVFGESDRPQATKVAQLPIVWIGDSANWSANAEIALLLFEPPCLFRQAAIGALDRAGIQWRLAFTSPSLAGLWAGVSAGLGVTVRTPEGLPARLTVLDSSNHLPPLPNIELSLHKSVEELSPAAARLREILLDTLSINLSSSF